MTVWHALVPIKQGANGKSRLASILSAEERSALVSRMARHVVSELQASGAVAEITILSAQCPEWWRGDWAEDRVRGLNLELAVWRETVGHSPILIIHADLPLLRAGEVNQLLAIAAAQGIALATDRAGRGSNALAIADRRSFELRFGPDSRDRHAAQVPALAVLDFPGLSTDVDTPEDLAFARSHGFFG